MDQFGATSSSDGLGGFVRAGVNVAQAGRHAVYLSGELQAGNIDMVTQTGAFVAIGYQLL
jgi:hypothetical protein